MSAIRRTDASAEYFAFETRCDTGDAPGFMRRLAFDPRQRVRAVEHVTCAQLFDRRDRKARCMLNVTGAFVNLEEAFRASRNADNTIRHCCGIKMHLPSLSITTQQNEPLTPGTYWTCEQSQSSPGSVRDTTSARPLASSPTRAKKTQRAHRASQPRTRRTRSCHRQSGLPRRG